jgi:hypothetical protein
MQGYFKTQNVVYLCQMCPYGCSACSSATSCSGCYPGYIYTSPLCVCPSGRGVDNVTGTCLHCSDSNCAVCSSNYNVCQTCIFQYGFTATNSCSVCSDANCINCLTDNTVCTACKQGYGLISGGCQICSNSNCQACPNSPSTCINCIAPYGRSGSSSCVSCSVTHCI